MESLLNVISRSRLEPEQVPRTTTIALRPSGTERPSPTAGVRLTQSEPEPA